MRLPRNSDCINFVRKHLQLEILLGCRLQRVSMKPVSHLGWALHKIKSNKKVIFLDPKKVSIFCCLSRIDIWDWLVAGELILFSRNVWEKFGIIHHCLWNIIQDFWICLFYWTRPVYKQGYKFFSRWAQRNREKLIALFVNWSSFLIKNKQIQNSVMWFLKQWCIIFYTMFCQILHK
jgi:hypothetical protein